MKNPAPHTRTLIWSEGSIKVVNRNFLGWPGAPLALASAILFGASTPLAKLLLGEGISPWLLASLLYLGSGLGLAFVYAARWLFGSSPEAPLRVADLSWLVLVVLTGGVIGPVLLMFGLTSTPASSASLLLNLEGLATMLIAWVVFHENVDHRLLVAAAAILTGAVILSWQGGPGGIGTGALAIVGACVAWGIDNNLTRKLSVADPVVIALVKGLAAGTVNFSLALGAGENLPGLPALGAAALIGFFGYGVSLVLFVFGLRYLGAARTGAYFSTAPFIGAAVSIPLFIEPVTLRLIGGGFLMALGVYLHLSEAHEHEHEHRAIEHEHRHVHDIHHQHEHGPDDPGGEPHTHRHRHDPLIHTHPHYPDVHHRHGHA